MASPNFMALLKGRPTTDLLGTVTGPETGASSIACTVATLAMTKAEHAGRLIILDRAAGIAVTLPPASGSGAVYRFFVKTTITSNTTTIKVANASDSMLGMALTFPDDAAPVGGWAVTANDDTITINGSSQGGYLGDQITITDVATNLFMVLACLRQTGTEATPFSASVT
jgi:hypothetical protein